MQGRYDPPLAAHNMVSVY